MGPVAEIRIFHDGDAWRVRIRDELGTEFEKAPQPESLEEAVAGAIVAARLDARRIIEWIVISHRTEPRKGGDGRPQPGPA